MTPSSSDTSADAIEPGDVFIDQDGDEFTVESIEDGKVHFEEFYPHYLEEVRGFIEDGLFVPKEEA